MKIHKLLISAFLILLALTAPRTAWADGVLRGTFQQERLLSGFTNPLKSEGRFMIDPNAGLIWETLRPVSIMTVVTPSMVLQSVSGAPEIELSVERLPFLSRFSTIIQAVIHQDLDVLSDAFLIETVDHAANETVHLTPKPGSGIRSGIKRLTIEGGRAVQHVRLERPNGDQDVFVFSEPLDDAKGMTAEEQAWIEKAQ